MKKLIPALCMLLVAACLMGTSTYAWFSAGTTVEATGMSIEASSSGGLAITVASAKNNMAMEATAFTSTEVDVTTGWNNGAEKVNPTSTANGEDWFNGQAANADDWENKNAAFTYAAEDAISAEGAVGAGYFYHTQVYIKTLNQNAVTGNVAKLYVQSLEVDVGDQTGDLSKALRVAFVCGGKVVVFAPNQASGFVGTHVVALAETSTGAKDNVAADSAYNGFVAGTNGSSTTSYLADLIYGDTKGNYAKVDMFLYYEGQDANCMTINAVNLDEVTVNVTFGSTVPTAG